MDKYIYVYDLNDVLIDRYPASIANKIKSIRPESKFIFIYSEKCSRKKPHKIPADSNVYYIRDLSINKLEKITTLYPPQSFITIAQRIPDMWMLSYFNNKSVDTYVVQHGLWSDKLERIPLLLLTLSKIRKICYYLIYIYNTCKLNRFSFFEMVYDLYLFLLKGHIDVKNTKYLDNQTLRGSTVFVFDETWDEYYIQKYGYSKESIVYIGNPDDLLLKNIDLKKEEDAICYLCQSLVEDGRYTRKKYLAFMRVLNNIAVNKRLIIKLHPRSKIQYYNIFKKNKNVTVTYDLPVCNRYIGHYTSLLSTVKKITNNILIWKLYDHHIPEYFYQFASIVTDSEKELTVFANNKYNHSAVLQNKLELKDSITIIANHIIRNNKNNAKFA